MARGSPSSKFEKEGSKMSRVKNLESRSYTFLRKDFLKGRKAPKTMMKDTTQEV